jgi:hypothetical protein
VALAATGVAVWQARVATTAAGAAVASASAADRQARLLAVQVEDVRTEWYRRDTPEFVLTIGSSEVGAYRVRRDGRREFVSLTRNARIAIEDWMRSNLVELRMSAGPGAVAVTVTADHVPATEIHLFDGGPHRMIKNATRTFTVIVPHRLSGQALELVIHSTELDGSKRSWICRQGIAM